MAASAGEGQQPVAAEGGIEERVELLNELVGRTDPKIVADFQARFDMSWIFHDSALEGVVYSLAELETALSDKPVTDTALIPTYDEIRQHRAAIELVRDLAAKKATVDLDTVKKIHAVLDPEEAEGAGKGLKYRKDMPLHRLYFHDIATPDKIAPAMRAIFDWMKSPDTKRSTHPVRLAAKLHSKMLEVYPFPKHSGKVARLVMNVVLLKHGYPPCVIHATERQRYYDALKLGPNQVAALVNESLVGAVERSVRYFEEVLEGEQAKQLTVAGAKSPASGRSKAPGAKAQKKAKKDDAEKAPRSVKPASAKSAPSKPASPKPATGKASAPKSAASSKAAARSSRG